MGPGPGQAEVHLHPLRPHTDGAQVKERQMPAVYHACFNVSHDLMHDQQNLLTTFNYILYALKPSCNMQKAMKLRYLNPLIHWIFSDPNSKGLWEGVIFFLHGGIRNKKLRKGMDKNHIMGGGVQQPPPPPSCIRGLIYYLTDLFSEIELLFILFKLY